MYKRCISVLLMLALMVSMPSFAFAEETVGRIDLSELTAEEAEPTQYLDAGEGPQTLTLALKNAQREPQAEPLDLGGDAPLYSDAPAQTLAAYADLIEYQGPATLDGAQLAITVEPGVVDLSAEGEYTLTLQAWIEGENADAYAVSVISSVAVLTISAPVPSYDVKAAARTTDGAASGAAIIEVAQSSHDPHQYTVVYLPEQGMHLVDIAAQSEGDVQPTVGLPVALTDGYATGTYAVAIGDVSADTSVTLAFEKVEYLTVDATAGGEVIQVAEDPGAPGNYTITYAASEHNAFVGAQLERAGQSPEPILGATATSLRVSGVTEAARVLLTFAPEMVEYTVVAYLQDIPDETGRSTYTRREIGTRAAQAGTEVTATASDLVAEEGFTFDAEHVDAIPSLTLDADAVNPELRLYFSRNKHAVVYRYRGDSEIMPGSDAEGIIHAEEHYVGEVVHLQEELPDLDEYAFVGWYQQGPMSQEDMTPDETFVMLDEEMTYRGSYAPGGKIYINICAKPQQIPYTGQRVLFDTQAYYCGGTFDAGEIEVRNAQVRVDLGPTQNDWIEIGRYALVVDVTNAEVYYQGSRLDPADYTLQPCSSHLDIVPDNRFFPYDDPDNFVTSRTAVYENKAYGPKLNDANMPLWVRQSSGQYGPLYSLSKDGPWTSDIDTVSFTDVTNGWKNVYIKYEEKGLRCYVGEARIEVTQRPILLAALAAEKTYDGNPYNGKGFDERMNVTGSVDTLFTVGRTIRNDSQDQGGEGLVDNHYLERVTVTSVGSPVNARVYPGNLAPTAGRVLTSAGGDMSGNYRIVADNADFTIHKRFKEYEKNETGTFVVGDTTKIYDSLFYGIQIIDGPTNPRPSGDLTYSIDYKTSNSPTWRADPYTISDVKDSPLTVYARVDNENETYIGVGIVTIKPRPITVTAQDHSMQYTGKYYNTLGYKHFDSAQADAKNRPEGGVTVTSAAVSPAIVTNQLLSKVTVISRDHENSEPPYKVGNYFANLAPSPNTVAIMDRQGRDVTDNYDISYLNGTLTITKKQTPADIVGDKEVEYDGTPHAPDVDPTIPGDVKYKDDNDNWVDTPPTQTEVGEKVVDVKIEGEDEDFVGTGKIKVYPRKIVITALDQSFIYNKMPYNQTGNRLHRDADVAKGVSVGYDGATPVDASGAAKSALVGGDRIGQVLVTSTGAPVDANAYPDNLVPSAATIVSTQTRDQATNYEVRYLPGLLTIGKRPVILEITDPVKEKDYDGDPQKPDWNVEGKGNGTPDSGLIPGDTIPSDVDLTGDGTYPGVGDYDATIRPGTNPNYEVTVGPPGKLTIYGRVHYHSNYPAGFPASGAWANVTHTDPTRYVYGAGVTRMPLAAIQATRPDFRSDGLEFIGWRQVNATYGAGTTFTMDRASVDLYAVWRQQSYTLTVRHRVSGNDSQYVATDTRVLNLTAGQPYNVSAVSSSVYTPLTANVSGTMPGNDLTLTIYYTRNATTPPITSPTAWPTATPTARPTTRPGVTVRPGATTPAPTNRPGGGTGVRPTATATATQAATATASAAPLQTLATTPPVPLASPDQPYVIFDHDVPLGNITSLNVGECYE